MKRTLIITVEIDESKGDYGIPFEDLQLVDDPGTVASSIIRRCEEVMTGTVRLRSARWAKR